MCAILSVTMDGKKSSGGSSKKKKKSSKSGKKKSGKSEKTSEHDEDNKDDDDDDVDDNATDGYDICSAENCVKPTGESLLGTFVWWLYLVRFCHYPDLIEQAPAVVTVKVSI